ncbi:MAG: DsbA family oxidoreductase [Acidiferrobacterales bacterium]
MSDRLRPELRVTVFSDYVCPFCYLGFLRMERLREAYDLRINWCMMELHADSPQEGRRPTDLGYSPEQWDRMAGDLNVLGAHDGVRWSRVELVANSHRALLLAEAAKELGTATFYPLHRRLFEVCLCEGRNLADERVLRAEIAALGIDPALPDRAWQDVRYERRLREQALAARDLGVDVTPTFFFGRQALRGLQPAEVLVAAARAAAQEQGAETEREF